MSGVSHIFEAQSSSRPRRSLSNTPSPPTKRHHGNGTHERQISPPLTPPLRELKTKAKLSGYAADCEKTRRHAQFDTQHQAFLAAARQRALQRRDLKTHNRIWAQAQDRMKARLKELDKERVTLEEDLTKLAAARKAYNAENKIEVCEEEDIETERRWENFFELERDGL